MTETEKALALELALALDLFVARARAFAELNAGVGRVVLLSPAVPLPAVVWPPATEGADSTE